MTNEEQRALDAALREARSPEEDDDAYWAAVGKVERLCTREVFEELARLAESSEVVVRVLVTDILRFPGATQWTPKELSADRSREVSDPPFREETIALFARILRAEKDPRVIAAVGTANVDLSDPRMAELMLPFSSA